MDGKSLTIQERALISRKRVIAESIARKREAKLSTLNTLERFRKGIAPQRDTELVNACLRINHKICELKQNWLPQFLFKQYEGPLFHVEGTSEAILYNYIPDTPENVHVVYERHVIVNYTGMRVRLENYLAVDIPEHCEFICSQVKVFSTDLVSTQDSFLAEVFAERIEFYAHYKR